MDKNILYQNLDILSVMEACEDKSKDFILLFMPTTMGGTVGESSRQRKISTAYDEWYHENGREYADFGRLYFSDLNDYNDYVTLVKKVIQNAGRILGDEGIFCFAVPQVIKLLGYETLEALNVQVLLEQTFAYCKVLPMPSFSVETEEKIGCGEELSTRRHFTVGATPYTLYVCCNCKAKMHGRNWSIYGIKRPPNVMVDDFLEKNAVELTRKKYAGLNKWEWLKGPGSIAKRLFNTLLIRELRQRDVLEAVEKMSFSSYLIAGKSDDEIAQIEKAHAQLRDDTLAILNDKNNWASVCECLIYTLYEQQKNARVLFPFDRNAECASVANRLGLNWTSLYKISLCDKEISCRSEEMFAFDSVELKREDIYPIRYQHVDYLKNIEPYNYEVRNTAKRVSTVHYDENAVSSIAEINKMKQKVAKYSNLLNEIVKCSVETGDQEDPDMEEAVHSIIKLAVKGQKGTIKGDEAENWYGDGWEKLSEKCRDYLQTATAFEKLSALNETADYAPIVIEYCRAVELEMNIAVMKPYMDSIKPEKAKKKHGNDSADYFQKIIDKYSDEPQTATMMLGEIGMSLRDAAKCGPDDIHQTLKEYCIKGGKKHLLDSDNVGKYVLISKIRNQSAHPSSLDKGCVDQIRNLVRQGLKAQQSVNDNQPIKDEPLVCAVIGPDGNKLAQSQNTEAFRAAIRNQISVLDQSRIQQFASAGNTGFDLIVSEILMDYKKENKKHRYVRLTEYLPCNRGTMKFPTVCRERALQVDKDAKVIVSGSIDNAATREACQRKALEKAQFCIAYYKPGGGSKIEEMVNEAIRERGLIVWNAYGIG